MDAWRQEKMGTVTQALERIDRRTDKLVRRINGSSNSVGPWQRNIQVSVWEDEVARLQDMSDRLLEFRGKLYLYSDRAYADAQNAWETEIKGLCKKSENVNNNRVG